MAKKKLSDKEAKNILRKWPVRTRKLWTTPRGDGYWLRAQPKPAGVSTKSPTINSPGSNLFSTQPDGMWIYICPEFSDAVCIEVCGTIQNLRDKRSRYAPATHGLILTCPRPWLLKRISIQKGSERQRWKACETIPSEPDAALALPVRHLRVLFALPNVQYQKWSSSQVPGGHEYFCQHSSLDSYTSQATQRFLRRMSFESHFLTRIGS